LPLSEEEASVPFYQKRTIYSDELLQNYTIYKKSVRNGEAAIIPESFFSSNDAIKPDGTKIVQALANLPQINIIDTHTGEVSGFRTKQTPGFSFFETKMEDRNIYYMRVQADDNYIYASYWGKGPWESNDTPFINTIHVFDWHGKLLYELISDQAIYEIWLDPVRNRLYTTDMRTDDVFYLDLVEIY
jgi:hypothetical protein